MLLIVTRCITVIIYQLWCGGVSGTAWIIITYVLAIYFMGNRGYFYGFKNGVVRIISSQHYDPIECVIWKKNTIFDYLKPSIGL